MHWKATILTGFAFACVALMPHALQRLEVENAKFQGIEIMPGDAEEYYAARVKEISDGDLFVADAYRTTKDHPFLQPALPEAVIAFPAMLLRVDPVLLFVMSKGVFAVVLMITLTGLFHAITRQPLQSLAAAAVVLMAGSALSSPWNLWAFLTDPNFSYNFLRFTRPINPQWSATLVFSTMWCIALWIEQPDRWKVITAALLTVLALYSYVYSWTYIGAVMVLLLGWYAWKRDTERIRELLRFAVIFVVFGMPYFFALYETMQHPWYSESAIRFGLVDKRVLVGGVWAVVFVALALCSKRLWPKIWPLLPALSIGGLIALNQQLITGTYIVPHHYHWYFIFPLAAGTAVLVALFLLKKYKQLPLLLTIAAVVFGGLQQQRAYAFVRNVWGERQSFAAVFREIEQHPGSVVYASPASRLPDLIPVYTSNDVYTAQNANLFLGPEERERNTTFFDFWIRGITPQEAEKRFYTDLRDDLSSQIFSIYYRELLGSYDLTPDAVVENLVEEFRAFFALSLQHKLELYPLDLAIKTPWDTETDAWLQIIRAGEVVWEKEGFLMIAL